MNLKAFFVATLSSALDLGIAVPDDVLRHVTPDVLATHLPRPLWARLLTACVGAPRVDAQLVVETIGVPNLCEHVPAQIIWDCIQELGARSLGGVVMAPPASLGASSSSGTSSRPTTVPTVQPASSSRPVPLSTPPPPPASEPKPAEARPPVTVGPSIPSPLDEADGRSRVPAGQRFRPSNTGMGRLATNSGNPGTQRRPQAQATTPPSPAVEPERDRGERSAGSADRGPTTPPPRPRRGQTEADYDLETFVGGKDDWKTTLAVEDEQLVDWSASDETVTNGEEISRKRELATSAVELARCESQRGAPWDASAATHCVANRNTTDGSAVASTASVGRLAMLPIATPIPTSH